MYFKQLTSNITSILNKKIIVKKIFETKVLN